MTKKIPLTKPYISFREEQAIREVLRSGWLTQGLKVRQFEEVFASYVGSKYACAVSSCSVALHIALIAVGVKPGNIVITVSHSFIATANAIRNCFAEPAFIDIEPDSYNMSLEGLKNFLENECEQRNEGLYYKKTKEVISGQSPLVFLDKQKKKFGRVSAILTVHQMGMPCNMKSILVLAKKYNLPIIEDAACAFGSRLSINYGRTFEKVGKPHGDIACFSFHPRKVITTGEGGMITTNNRKYDEKFRLLRQHGMTVSDMARHDAKKIMIEKYPSVGYNYKMTDMQAAIGIEQLKKIPEILAKRRKLERLYRKYLKGVDWLRFPKESLFCRTNWQSYPVRISKKAPLTRDELMQYLHEKGVSTKTGIMNAHQEKPYSNSYFYLPESEKARDEVVLLPLYPGLKINYVKQIVKLIKKL